MILFVNVFITDKAFTFYDRGLLTLSNDRVDIFKYSLASLSVIEWSHVIIYYDLDINYREREKEIDEYLKSLFKDPVIYHYRNDRQPEWKVALEKLFLIEGEEFVWFLCNDDHVFIDYETGLLDRILIKLEDLSKTHKYVSCYFSHWPEMLYYGRTPPRFTQVGMIEDSEDFFVTIWKNCDSIQIVNKNLLRHWWFEHDYGDKWMPRTDGFPHNVISPETVCIIPYRELVRHFDGYSHNGIDINACQPLFIPDGFFDNKIRISYCAESRKNGYVHVNPLIENYSTVDKQGADCRCLLEDLPLFWRAIIAKTIVNKKVDERLLLKCRNEAVLRVASQKLQLSLKELSKKLKIALKTDATEHSIPKQLSYEGTLKRRSNIIVLKRNWIKDDLKVSVIIVNWFNHISSWTLDSLLQQDCSKNHFEIIYVDLYNNYSLEVTKKADVVIVCKEEGKYHKHIGYNIGLLHAKGQIITVCESDVIFPPNYISSTITAFNLNTSDYPSSIVLLYHERQVKQLHPESPMCIRKLQKAKGLKSNLRTCMSIRKSDALLFGGFDESHIFMEYFGGSYKDLGKRLVYAGLPEILLDERTAIFSVFGTTSTLRSPIKWIRRFIHPEVTNYNKIAKRESSLVGRLLPIKENIEVRALRMSQSDVDTNYEKMNAQMVHKARLPKWHRLRLEWSIRLSIVEDLYWKVCRKIWVTSCMALKMLIGPRIYQLIKGWGHFFRG